MPQAVPVVYLCFMAIALATWRFWRSGAAPIAVLLGGAILLPTARLPESDHVEFPFWVTPACLTSSYFATKVSMAGLACLAGLIVFERRRLSLPSRLKITDVAITAWCLYPLVHIFANATPPLQALADTLYQTLAWGVPYLVGRIFGLWPDGRAKLARGFVIVGLICLPLAAIEFVTGPIVYEILYGFHPYAEQGAGRYIGNRPLLFFEDGNQAGIFLATSALAAIWLWRSDVAIMPEKRRNRPIAAALLIQAVVAQSAGAVVLLVASLGSLEALRRLGRSWPLIAVMALGLLYVGVRATGKVDAKALAQKTAVGRALIDASIRVGRKSFGWRLRREEPHTKFALRRPWFGYGRWDWWRTGPERPWGLPTLVLGQHGIVGLGLLSACFVLPIVTFLRSNPPKGWASPARAATVAIAAAMAINVADAILNGAFLTAMMMVAGGLTVPPNSTHPGVKL